MFNPEQNILFSKFGQRFAVNPVPIYLQLVRYGDIRSDQEIIVSIETIPEKKTDEYLKATKLMRRVLKIPLTK